MVIPAKAGISLLLVPVLQAWKGREIPAFAGMTVVKAMSYPP